MKLRLVFKADGPGCGEGEVGRLCEARREAERGGGPGLPLQLRPAGAVSGIEIGGEPLEVAGDRLPADEFLVRVDGRLAGMGVQASPLHARFFDQLRVEQAVLAGNFCRGVFCLSPGDPVRLQHDDVQALLF